MRDTARSLLLGSAGVAALAGLLACRAAPTAEPAAEVETPAPESAPSEPAAAATAAPEQASAPRVVVKARSEGVPRAERRRELAEQVARTPGWQLSETAHYFVLSRVGDSRLQRELEQRVEAVRRLFQLRFPHPHADPVPVHSSPNVLRVFPDTMSFHEYGGPGGSAGYWNHTTEELVVIAPDPAQPSGSDWRFVQATLFFEYLDATFGRPPAPPWFLYGHSMWYGDFAHEGQDWVERPNPTEVQRARALVEKDLARPSLELVSLDVATFHNEPGAIRGQAWSLVRFLRTGGAEVAGWDERYGEILDTYFEVFVATRDPELALDQAFADVDWSALDAAWRGWVLAPD